MHSKIWQKFFLEKINDYKKLGRYRTFKTIESDQDTVVVLQGREYLSFCSNNYLGLANHPSVREAAIEAVRKYGFGSGASRLISGNMEPHSQLERELAGFKKTKNCLLFPTGYMANVGAITALAGKDDAVILDRMNHASIIDGAHQSGARLFVYEHCNVDDLRKILKRAAGRFNKILVITDSVFSMDGDIAPLPELAEAVREHDALLMIDEAHATGVLGKEGRGTLEHFGMDDENSFVVMGTLSKALGSLGGFVAGDDLLIDYLRNSARSQIYTTALPPAVCAASIAALKIVKEEAWRRRQLAENVKYIKEKLSPLGFDLDDNSVPIIPLITGGEEKTIKISNYLFENGILIPPIRPPTVPKDKCRLRLTVMATHTREQLERVGELLGSFPL